MGQVICYDLSSGGLGRFSALEHFSRALGVVAPGRVAQGAQGGGLTFRVIGRFLSRSSLFEMGLRG